MPILDSDIPNLLEQWELESASGNRVGLKAGKVLAESGGAVARVAGKVGAGPYAIELPASGTSFLAMATDDAELDPGTGEFTVCFWTKILEDGSGDIILLRKGDGYRIDTQSNGGIFRAYALGGSLVQIYASNTDQAVRRGEWQFVALRRNNTTNNLTITVRTPGYGQTSIHSTAGAASLGNLNSSSALNIGAATRTRGAQIDNVWYFTRCLTDTELDRVYNSGAGDTYGGNPTLALGLAEVYAGTNNTIPFNGLSLVTPWTAGTPGAPSVSVSGGGATKLGQTMETTSSGTVTVSIPEGATGSLTVTVGGLSASVPIVALPAGSTIPPISVPANYSLNSAGCFPVVAQTLTGTIATGQVKLPIITTQTGMALVGVNACSVARTISVSYRNGLTGAFTAGTFGGNATITVQPWEFYVTDTVPGLALTAGATLCAREESAIPGGSAAISGWHKPSANVGMTVGATSQLTATGDLTALASDGNAAFGPFAILSPGLRASVIAGGDSITFITDTTSGHANVGLSGIPRIIAGMNGLTHFVESNGSIAIPQYRALIALARLASHYVDGLGHNTVGLDGSGSGSTAINLRDKVRSLITKVREVALAQNPTRAFHAYSWTLTPWTSAGDGNTPVSPFSAKFTHAGDGTSYNELLRADFANFVYTNGFVDIHSRTRRGTGTTTEAQQWLTTPTMTTDGTHVVSSTDAANQIQPAWASAFANIRLMLAGTLSAAGGAGQITGTFTASTGGQGTISAQVQYSADGGNTWIPAAGQTASPLTITGLAAGTYQVRVQYTDSSSWFYRCWSNVVSVTVTAAPTNASPAPPATTNTAGTQVTLPFSAGEISAPQALAISGHTCTLVTALPSSGGQVQWNIDPPIIQGQSLAGATLNGSPLTVTNNSTVDGTAPSLQSATLAANGRDITLAFSEAVTGTTGWTVRVNGAVVAATLSGAGASRTLTLASAAFASDLVRVSYGSGNMADLSGNALPTVSNFSVTNNSTVAHSTSIITWGF